MIVSARFKVNAKSRWRVLTLLASSVLLTGMLSSCAPKIGLDERVARQRSYEDLLSKAVLALRVSDKQSLYRADAMLRLAEELVPRTARVADALGCLAIRNSENEKAKSFFQEALRRDPYYARAHAHLGFLAEVEGRKDEASSYYETAIRLAPLDPRVRWNYASYLYGRNSKEEGTRELEKALSLLSPKELEALRGKASFLD